MDQLVWIFLYLVVAILVFVLLTRLIAVIVGSDLVVPGQKSAVQAVLMVLLLLFGIVFLLGLVGVWGTWGYGHRWR